MSRTDDTRPEATTGLAIIEFLGISGAGKTTLAAMAIEHLRRQNLPAFTVPEARLLAFRRTTRDRFWRPVVRFTPGPLSRLIGRFAVDRSRDTVYTLRDVMVHNTEMVEVVMAATRRRRAFEIKPDTVVAWWLNSMIRYTMATCLPPPAIIVADEGIINRAVSLFGFRFSDADRDDLDRYLRSVRMPDLVIHVEVTPDVAEQRARKASRGMRFKNDADRRAFFDGSARCVTVIVETLESMGTPVARIPGDGPVAESSALLGDALARSGLV